MNDKDEKGFPRFQWSLFTNDRQGQVVVRADSYDEFVDLYGKMQTFITAEKLVGPAAKTVNAAQTDADPEWIRQEMTSNKEIDESVAESEKGTSAGNRWKCETCGEDAAFRSGVSEKSGKKWQGVFCTANREHVKWMR